MNDFLIRKEKLKRHKMLFFLACLLACAKYIFHVEAEELEVAEGSSTNFFIVMIKFKLAHWSV